MWCVDGSGRKDRATPSTTCGPADVLLEALQIRYEVYDLLGRPRRVCRQSGQKTWRSSLDSTASVMEQEAALVEALEKDFVYLRDHYFDKSAYIRHGHLDEPVVCLLGPTKITARVWDEVCKKVFPDLEKRPKLLAMQGSALQEAHAVDVGCMRGYLKNAAAVYLTRCRRFCDDFYEDPAALMGSAFPSYRDYYAEGNDGPSRGFIGPHRGKTFDAGLDSAQRWKPPFLQLLTWNNWQEGTQLEPSARNGSCGY